MKKNLQSTNLNYIIKPINTIDKGKGRNQGQNQDCTPFDIGNSYITVPVYKTTEKFTRKQIKDYSSMYTINRTTQHSFVLSLQSDPSVHIAVPYYCAYESVVNGKTVVTVSNFFPTLTDQATPPSNVNVIGQTAQLIPIPSNSLNAFYNNPVCDSSTNSSIPPIPPINKQIQMVSPLDPSKTNGTQMFCLFLFLIIHSIASKQQPLSKDVIRRGIHSPNDLQYRNSLQTSVPIMEPSLKRQRVSSDTNTSMQSFWSENGFVCTHSKEWKRQELSESSTVAEFSLFKSLLNYMIDNRVLRVKDIPLVFKGNEASIIRIANILASLHVIRYIVVEEEEKEGMFVFPEIEDSLVCPVVNDRSTFNEEEIKREENELIRMRKRIEKLESLTSSECMTPGLVFNTLSKEDTNLLNEPLYLQLLGIPIIRDSISGIASL